jgi:oligopeptide transport system permease protein
MNTDSVPGIANPRHRIAVACAVVLGLLVLLALFGPALSPVSYDYLDKLAVWSPPGTPGHWLGTDFLGRDVFVRTLVGLRISLAIGILATAVAVAIGIAWGAIAGYAGGWLDEGMMRIVDGLYSLPFMFLVILLMAALGNSVALIFIAIGAVEWLTIARIVRAQTLSLRETAFVEAARVAGAPPGAIIRRHIVPNLLGPVVAYATLTVPSVILAESFLSFLGLGIQEPLASLGTLIARGAQDSEIAPWLLLCPTSVMVVTLLALTLLGESLRAAVDPRER